MWLINSKESNFQITLASRYVELIVLDARMVQVQANPFNSKNISNVQSFFAFRWLLVVMMSFPTNKSSGPRK